MKVHWFLKNDPIRSNSSLVRGVWCCEWLRQRAVDVSWSGPPPRMNMRNWHEDGVLKVVPEMRSNTVGVVQKIWSLALLQKLKANNVSTCFDADDEFDPSNPVHRLIIAAATVVVCSSSVTETELRKVHRHVFRIPCMPEQPKSLAVAPSVGGQRIIWTGYKDTNLIEVEQIKRPIQRLHHEIGSILVVHGSGEAKLSWSKGVVDVPFNLERKDEVMATAQIGVSNKPFNTEFWRKTEDKVVTYMAYGIVPLCSPIPSYSGLIKDGANGFLIAPDNMDDWYRKMKLLLTDASLWRELSKAARATIGEGYSREIIGSAWFKALRQCAEER